MADDPYAGILDPPSAKAPVSSDQYAGILEPGTETIEPPGEGVVGHSYGLAKRIAGGVQKLPRDIVDSFMEGVHGVTRAPEILSGNSQESAFKDLGPDIEKRLLSAGLTPDQAKAETARLMRSYQGQEALVGGVLGVGQAAFSLFGGAIRSFGGRPLEQEFGIPSQVTETFTGLALGARAMTRVRIRPNGAVDGEIIGRAPGDIDFANAARALEKGAGR